MPMLNICRSAGNNITPQFAIAFLSREKKADYTQVLKQYKELLQENNILQPKVFVTNRELALLNSINKLFPISDYILCCQHVNINVVAKTKKHFKVLEEWDAFYKAQLAVIDLESLEYYEKNLKNLRKLNKKAVAYVKNTWLVQREKLVCFGFLNTFLTTKLLLKFKAFNANMRSGTQVKLQVNKALYFRNTTTSCNKSSYAAIKGYLRKSTRDYKHFFNAICVFWDNQHRAIKEAVAIAKQKPRNATKIQLFLDIIGFVHTYALIKIVNKKSKLLLKLDTPLAACTCLIEQSIGLPCYYTIHAKQQGPSLIALVNIYPYQHYNQTLLAEHVQAER